MVLEGGRYIGEGRGWGKELRGKKDGREGEWEESGKCNGGGGPNALIS